MTRERQVHSVLSTEIIAPIRSDSPDSLIEAEAMVFEASLQKKAVLFGIGLKRMVSLELLPSSMVVMEDFAKNYAEKNETGARRQARIEHQYHMGAMIGLAAMALHDPVYAWNERSPHTVTSLASLVDYNKLPGDEMRIDPITASIIDQLAEHTTADLEDPDSAILATKIGYYAARQLAALSIES